MTAMSTRTAPDPTVMPVDRESWRGELGLANFVNVYYQYRDLQELGECNRVLIMGPGQGLELCVLNWRGYEITTLDIDHVFNPDVVGSAHDLNMFEDQAFDAVVASHVLEHMAEPYLDLAFAEIARVAKYALIYLPRHGLQVQSRLKSNFRNFDFSITFDLFNFFKRPDGVTPRYMCGQHFWEVGMRGFRVRDMKRRMAPHFDPIKVYRNRDWPCSQNFILRSKRTPEGLLTGSRGE